MKKKIISTLLCTAMLATMVAGCGVEKSDGGSDTEGSASSVAEMKGTGDNEINILIYAQDHEGFKVEVSEVQSDDIETRLTTAVSAGDLSTLPDIFLMQDNSFQKYATNYPDIFTDLTDSGIDFSEFSSAKVCRLGTAAKTLAFLP